MVLFIVYCSWNMGHLCISTTPQFSTKVRAAGGDLSGGAGDNAVNFTTGRWTRWGLETGDWRCLPRDQCLSLVTNCLMWPSEECAKHCKPRQLISNTTPWPTVHYLGLVPPI